MHLDGGAEELPVVIKQAALTLMRRSIRNCEYRSTPPTTAPENKPAMACVPMS
ncbi:MULTISPECIES: hypothetical protein [unclassified Anaeromyxobacter]|uniref:hypothetical protein n=1 Tax=unclassified Anaeromyxobacter TaxID=2620896 RepID=UPI001F574B16|nr:MULTISPECIES: hypothetical protein [unclassified Anaeromyxobacter]